MSRSTPALVLAAIVVLLVAAGAAAAFAATQKGQTGNTAKMIPAGIHKIKHVVVIMQENRSFDSYFGTYPGADGIPMTNGVPTVCMSDPRQHRCVRPFHDRADANLGGPHGANDMVADEDGGKMDGFITRLSGGQDYPHAPVCGNPFNPRCNGGYPPDVMGYHTGADLPNYWAYARSFVLQDHMFEPVISYSTAAHLYMVSGWSALCSTPNAASSCLDEPANPDVIFPGPVGAEVKTPNYAWTDLTYLLDRYKVSWKYYVADGTGPYCSNNPTNGATCIATQQRYRGTPQLWNVLPYFTTVQGDHQLGNIQTLDHFYADAKGGRLPAVSWIVPSLVDSEHPAALLSAGQSYVTQLINAIMRSPDWTSTAIFMAWDDWGGFYDHVVPPRVDQDGYGIRVPGLVISPYAKKGYIDHQTLSFDAYLTFIEDDFLGGRRLDPTIDGRPDPRPTVRENVTTLGDLTRDFDFNQRPRKALILSPTPRTDLLPAPKR